MSDNIEAINASSMANEMMVLGAILNSIDNAKIGLQLVHEDDFYERRHKTILRSIKEVFTEKEVVDIELIRHNLSSIGKLEEGFIQGLSDREASLYANINPKNEASIEFFKKKGFKHLSSTYVLNRR